MIPKFKRSAMFKRSPRIGQDQTAQPVEGVRLPDPVSDIELLDMDLFTNDFDLWFTKAIVQCYLAIAIQKEHLGHAAVNPKAIFEHVEARHWTEPSQNVGSNARLQNSGSQLFSRIKAARAAKNDRSLDVFLNELFFDIQSSCRELRNEQAVELDASSKFEPINRATTPSFTSSSNSDSENSDEETNTPTETERGLPDDVIPSPSLSIQGGLPLPPERASPGSVVPSPSLPVQGGLPLQQSHNTIPTAINTEKYLPDRVVQSPSLSAQDGFILPERLKTEQSLHRYTSMLFEYASVSGTQPEYSKEWVSPDLWRCKAVFNGTQGVGESRSWKYARHMASQKICEALGIVEE